MLLLNFEFALLDFIQKNMHSGIGDMLMIFFSRIGDAGMVWIILAVVFMLSRRTRRVGSAMLVALAVEVLLCNVLIKPLVARIRPCDINTLIILPVKRPQDFSFPSGHTAAAFASVSAMYFSRCKWWPAAAVLAALIAFSRLYLYLHFPSDILAGILLGILTGWLGSFLFDILAKSKMAREHNI